VHAMAAGMAEAAAMNSVATGVSEAAVRVLRVLGVVNVTRGRMLRVHNARAALAVSSIAATAAMGVGVLGVLGVVHRVVGWMLRVSATVVSAGAMAAVIPVTEGASVRSMTSRSASVSTVAVATSAIVLGEYKISENGVNVDPASVFCLRLGDVALAANAEMDFFVNDGWVVEEKNQVTAGCVESVEELMSPEAKLAGEGAVVAGMNLAWDEDLSSEVGMDVKVWMSVQGEHSSIARVFLRGISGRSALHLGGEGTRSDRADEKGCGEAHFLSNFINYYLARGTPFIVP
jgi:hypothetical protein